MLSPALQQQAVNCIDHIYNWRHDAGKRRGQTNRRKVRKQKKGRHAEAALTGEGLSEEVLQEQQQVMGDLSQVGSQTILISFCPI